MNENNIKVVEKKKYIITQEMAEILEQMCCIQQKDYNAVIFYAGILKGLMIKDGIKEI